jgi:hypothetical protein
MLGLETTVPRYRASVVEYLFSFIFQYNIIILIVTQSNHHPSTTQQQEEQEPCRIKIKSSMCGQDPARCIGGRATG